MNSYQFLKDGIVRRAVAFAVIAAVVSILMISQISLAQNDHQVYSGKTYSYQVPPAPAGKIYSFLWRASDGTSSSYTDRIFNWTAPVVSSPKEVTINVTVVCITCGGCSASNQITLTVNPKPLGQISLEKSLDGDINNVRLGDTISYTINITNSGQTNVTYLPLTDSYPKDFLKPVSSNPSWSADSGSVLSWNNILSSPLAPGRSFKVSASFHVVNITTGSVTNTARVEGAKDDVNGLLEPKEASLSIEGLTYECSSLGPQSACARVPTPFSAHLSLPSYSWTASNSKGNSVGGFDDSGEASVNWTPPGPGTYEISFNNICNQTVSVTKCSNIKIHKNCIYSSPVRVGDTVNYVYNVTNTGVLPLKDVKVSDVPDWGPGCTPRYVSGDDGNGILDPSETWRYECKYVIPDPLDYQVLSIKANQSEADRQGRAIQRLNNSRARLEIMMDKLKELRSSFNKSLARKTASQTVLFGASYTVYNYTTKLAGEELIETVDRMGAINRSVYVDPISDSTITTEYNGKGEAILDSYNSSRTRETLKIEYNKPSKFYRTVTIIDHTNGDSLILVILDLNGTILSKEYRKTPGYQVYVKRYWLKNVATVNAVDSTGDTVSDVDAFQLEILRPLPSLDIEKIAKPDPVQAGNTLTYTINYQNLGNETAHNVVVRESYNSNVNFISSSPLPDVGTEDTWSVGDLQKGGSGSIVVTTRVNPSVANGTLLRNYVGIFCNEGITANASINTTVLVSQPLLYINKTSSEYLLTPGEIFNYTITYKNIGNVNATNVTIDDIKDQGLEFPDSDLHLDITPFPSRIDLGNSHLYWNSAALNSAVLIPGASGTIEIKVKVSPSTQKKWVCNLYRISTNQTQGTYKTLANPVINSLFIRKTADKSTCTPGELINYTIIYGNEGDDGIAYGVIITDTLPNVEFVDANPMPIIQGKTLKWDKSIIKNLDALQPNIISSITLTVRIKERPIIKYDESGSVSGDGYIYDRKKLSTNIEQYSLTNFVEIYASNNPPYKPDSDSVSTIVADPGTEIMSVEHGSGHYEQEQLVHLNYSNKSIRLEKQIFAKHAPVTLSLPRNRKVYVNSLWSDRTTAKNYARNETVTESYLYMDLLHKNSYFLVGPNQTVYKSTGDFYGGIARIDYVKEDQHPVQDLSRPAAQISEEYHGSFKLSQSLDSYGEGLSYSKSTEGQGFVSSDKRVADTQRSFEAGSGSYQSDEIVKTGLFYKDSAMNYAPNNLTAGNFKTNYSSKWHEEMSTRNPEIGAAISERITSAESIKKEALMQDSTMAILGEFNGTADIKAVQRNGHSGKGSYTKENISVEERFVGNYKLDTTIAIVQGPVYLRPHINVTKYVLKQDEYTALFRINLTNDGNKTLSPVYIIDYLPDGLTFISSSLRPDSVGKTINWSLPSFQVGGKMSITLRASLKEPKSKFVNSVMVYGLYNGRAVRSFAACGFVLDWLSIGPSKPAPIIRPGYELRNYPKEGWAPPASFDLMANVTEYPLDIAIPCISCSSEIPENDGCSSCA